MQRVFTQDGLNSFTFSHLHINNYLLDLYKRDLQTTIIPFTCNVSSYKSDWIVFEIAIACSILPFIWQGKQSDECTWRGMSIPSRKLYKCKQVVYVIVVCVFYLRYSCNVVVVVACLLVYPLFYTDVDAIFLRYCCLCILFVCSCRVVVPCLLVYMVFLYWCFHIYSLIM